MAKLFLTNINLNTNELQFPVIHKLATAPTSPAPVAGQVYFNTADKFLYLYDGTAWDKITLSGEIVNADIKAGAAIDKTKISGTAVTLGDTGTVTSTMIADGTIVNGDIASGAAIDLAKLATNPLARANHTGTQASNTISDLASTVKGYRLDEFAVPTADLSLNSKKITNLLDPTAPQDAATKAYVDAARQGLDVKDSVRATSTANVTLTGTQTIDTVAVVAGNRVLLKNQTNGAENGIWVVAAGAWSRSSDADNGTKLTSGAFVFVEEGSQADSGWVLNTDGAITVGTTPLGWTQFSGVGQLIGGAGLTKTGNTLDVITANSSRIVVNADSIDLASITQAPTTPNQANTAVTAVNVDGYGRVTGVATSTRKVALNNSLLTVTGGLTSWTITHNLGTQDVIVQLRQVSNNELVEADVELTSTSAVTVRINSSATSIAADTYRVVVIA
jgi:hypothetical protein